MTTPGNIHAAEQGEASFRDLGKMYAAMYTSLRSEMPGPFALAVVVAYIWANPVKRS